MYLFFTDQELDQCVPYSIISIPFVLQQLFLPFLGKKIDLTLWQVIKTILFFGSRISGESRPKTFGDLNTKSILDFYNSSDFRKAEVSSAGFQASAKGCAKLASVMSKKGQSLMSEESWKKLHSKPKENIFGDLPDGKLRSNFTLGGLNYFDTGKFSSNPIEKMFYGNRDGFYGWFGLGGSIVQWNPELEIGFAFIPTYLDLTDLTNFRGSDLQQIVKDCAINCK